MEWDEQEDGPYPDFFFPNGYYWGDMKDGLPNGRGEAVFHDGSRYHGFFEDGVFQSPWWIERFWKRKKIKMNPFWSIPPFEPMHEQFEFSDGGLYFGWFKDGLPDTSYPDSDYQPKYKQNAYIFQYNYWEEGNWNPRFSSGWTFWGLVSEGRKDKGYFRPELGVDSVLRNLTCSEDNDIAENIRLRWRDKYYGKWSGEEFQPRSMKKIWDFPTYLETAKGIGIEVKSNTCKLIKRLRERHLDCLGLSVPDRELEDSGDGLYPPDNGINFAAVEKALRRSTDSVGEDPVDHYTELNKGSESQILYSLEYLSEIDWEAHYEYRYRGEFKGLVPHGKGQLLFAGPYSYHGEFRDGKYHGEGLEKFHHGVTKGVTFGIPKHMGADEIMNLTEEAISGMNLDDFVPASIGDERGEYRGQFMNGIREGKGVLKLDFDENNVPWKIFEGKFANGEPTVDGVWTYPGKEAMEKSAKEVAFRVSNKQIGAPEIDWTEKEECWQSNSGACVYCGKTCIEAPVSFWWEVYPKLALVLSCVECAEERFSNFDEEEMGPSA